jgi:hypothetical protein
VADKRPVDAKRDVNGNVCPGKIFQFAPKTGHSSQKKAIAIQREKLVKRFGFNIIWLIF